MLSLVILPIFRQKIVNPQCDLKLTVLAYIHNKLLQFRILHVYYHQPCWYK